MATSEALVETGRADRYLEQFAKHFAHQPGGIQARYDADGRLLVDFGGATCSMHATVDGLVLRAESAQPEDLGRLQRRLTDRLEQVGRRDGLVVRWNPDY